jgi:hypothetical protein
LRLFRFSAILAPHKFQFEQSSLKQSKFACAGAAIWQAGAMLLPSTAARQAALDIFTRRNKNG